MPRKKAEPEKRGRGRPKSDPTVVVSMRILVDEETAWSAAAEADGQSVAEWIRERCNTSIARRAK